MDGIEAGKRAKCSPKAYEFPGIDINRDCKYRQRERETALIAIKVGTKVSGLAKLKTNPAEGDETAMLA